jgi:DNA end-binding protein Ku
MTIAHATAPSRSSATAVISFGLINIPVSLYTATEETRVARSEYARSYNNDGSFQLHKVGRRLVDTITEQEVDRSDIVKCAQTETGELVELTDEEVAAVTLDSDGTAPIVALISTEQLISEYCVEKYYQVRPKAEKKGGQAHERAFTLLMKTLERRNQAALIRISLRNSVAKYAAITADGALMILHYTDGVRTERPMPSVDVTDAELGMAEKLLDAIGTEVPDMRDETAARIRDYVAAKATGATEVAAVPTPVVAAGSLEDLLAASLEATKAS